MRYLLLLLAVVILATSEKVNYKNYKVFRVALKSEAEYQFIKEIVESNKNYGYWTIRVDFNKDASIGILVKPGHENEFTKQMNASNLKYKLIFEDVQALIDRGMAAAELDPGFGWKRYHTLDEIYDWLDDLSKIYPSKVKTIIGGSTFEGRQIKGVRISFKENNPGIFIEGGIHAEEWIATATATYLINELLTSSDPKVRNLAESYDWYIFPTFNPDGYVYTYTTNRMWRKSRSRENNTDCIGVDLNRNWGYRWMEVGSSNDPCNNRYAGSSAFSEKETNTISKYIKSIGDKLFAYLGFHNFSQLFLIPYGHTTEHLDNYNETYAIGLKAASALAKRYGTQYSVGNIAEIFFPVSGSALDWVKTTLKLPVAYSIELRDEGYYGTLLPPEQIIPTGQEILDSLIAMFEEARKFGYPKSNNK